MPSGPPGTLDTSFGPGGIVTTPVGAFVTVSAVAVQSDGKIVAVGSASVAGKDQFLLVRYTADGTLDPAFGAGGKVLTAPVSEDAPAQGVALQADGKILVVGTTSTQCVLARYSNDGVLDVGFGIGGIVLFGGAGSAPPTSSALCPAVALRPDGKIVVAESFTYSHAAADLLHPQLLLLGSAMGFIQFNNDGTRDSSFPGNVLSFPDIATASAIAIQPDGKVLVAGSYSAPAPVANESIVVRFAVTGVQPDPSFGVGGLISAPLGIRGPEIALQPDGRIVVLTASEVSRFLADGTPDPAFGAGGKMAGISGEPLALQLQPNGKIVVAGHGVGNQYQFRLWRISTNGVLDSGFGNGGTVDTPIGTSSVALAVAIRPDGRIVAAGNTTTPAGGINVAVTRYFGDPMTTSSP